MQVLAPAPASTFPSGSADPPLRCQGCSQPRPQPGVRPALTFDRPLRRPAAGLSIRTDHQRLAAHVGSRVERLTTSQPQVFPPPPAEPDVHVPAHPALHAITLPPS